MPLTAKQVQETFQYDADKQTLRWKHRDGVKACVNASLAGKEITPTPHDNGWGNQYMRVTVKGRPTYVHRVVWMILYGDIPEGTEIDHIDGNGTNNHPNNLRAVRHEKNCRNMRRKKLSASGRVGVRYDQARAKWTAYGTAPGMQKVNLGRFALREHAVAAREEFERKLQYDKAHGLLKQK